MPENSRAIGLTVEIWNLLQRCWQQNPKKRPTMEEVVRKWEKFVGDDDVSNALPEEPEYVVEKGEDISRGWVKAMAPSPLEEAKPRMWSMSENPGPRTIPKLGHFRVSSAVVKARTWLGAIPQNPDSDVFQQTPKSEVTQQRPKVVSKVEVQVYETPQTLKVKKMCCGIM